MRTLIAIGIGTGNPRHMTLEAIDALNGADMVLIPRKGPQKDDLAEVRRLICRQCLTNPATRLVEFDLPVRDAATPDYGAGVDAWHDAIAATYRDLILAESGPDARIALLVWGDPSLYDSTLRIIDRLQAMEHLAGGLACDVIPGITSIQALAASHRIPLNTIGGAIHITTGRRLRAEGFPVGADTAIIMLDGTCAFQILPPDAYAIWWGAYLGTELDLRIAGPLAEVAHRILSLRAEARARHGWIMDTYLLRRLENS